MNTSFGFCDDFSPKLNSFEVPKFPLYESVFWLFFFSRLNPSNVLDKVIASIEAPFLVFVKEFIPIPDDEFCVFCTLQGINISHLGKRKIIFKMPFLGDMLVSWRV